MILKCCKIGCDKPAEVGTLTQGQSSDMEIHSCEAHVGELLEPGYSTVWTLGGGNIAD